MCRLRDIASVIKVSTKISLGVVILTTMLIKLSSAQLDSAFLHVRSALLMLSTIASATPQNVAQRVMSLESLLVRLSDTCIQTECLVSYHSGCLPAWYI